MKLSQIVLVNEKVIDMNRKKCTTSINNDHSEDTVLFLLIFINRLIFIYLSLYPVLHLKVSEKVGIGKLLF